MGSVISISDQARAKMRSRGGRWAAYRNEAFDSAAFGDVQFLRFGAGCTWEVPPPHLHDGAHGAGWKWVLVGEVTDEL